MENYKIIKKIGKGSFGIIYEANYNNKSYAIKKYEDIFFLKKEYNILIKFNSPNIVKIFEKIECNLIMEYLDMDLWNYINSLYEENKKMNKKLIQSYSFQILKGLNHCHSLEIFHGDLKPTNILIDKNGYLKLCDFGSSYKFGEKNLNRIILGTYMYSPPEILKKLMNSNSLIKMSYEIDIWSFGIIFIEMNILDNFMKNKIEDFYDEIKFEYQIKLFLEEIDKIEDRLNTDIDMPFLSHKFVKKCLYKRKKSEELLDNDYFDDFKFEF